MTDGVSTRIGSVRVETDPQVRATYVYLQNSEDRKVKKTINFGNAFVDVDADNNIIGLEILS